MAAVKVADALDHACGPEWTKQEGVGRINFKCPVCESETILINQAGVYIINTGAGQYIFDVSSGKMVELDTDDKSRRGMAMQCVCNNGHDFELDISYEITYDFLHISATMSEYSYSQACPDELIGHYNVEDQVLMREYREALYRQHLQDIGFVGEPVGGNF